MRPLQVHDQAKGKGPAPKRKRPVKVRTVYSDDSWSEDEAPANNPRPAVQGGAAYIPDEGEEVPIVHLIEDDNPELLPQELLGRPPAPYDNSDEEDEDHTGFWRPGDLEALVLGLNHYRDRLKGKFIGTSGGKERKNKAWAKVADFVNSRCGTRWSVGQCKGKARRYSLEVKNKYNKFRRELNKTGSPEIPDRMRLSKIEEMLLDYIGVEGVVGIPGIQGVLLRPDLGRNYLKKRAGIAKALWNHQRDSRPDYTEHLPTGRIHLPKKKK